MAPQPQPQPQPQQKQISLAGTTLTYFEWGQAQDEVLLFCHATGFHARCWDQVIRKLYQTWDHPIHAIALDQRGHGRSAKTPPYTWEQYGRDLIAFIEALDLSHIIGIGHSMGGHIQIQAAARQPQRFRNLVLLDPVVFDPASHREIHARMQQIAPQDFPTARRKNHWSSWQEMVERFKDRRPFSLWQPQVLEDYCRYGLLPASKMVAGEHSKETYVLACPPLVEATIYAGNVAFDIYPLLEKLTMPVLVVRAEARASDAAGGADFSKSPTWTKLAGALEQGTDVYLPQLSHLIPMQAPQRVAELILQSVQN